MTDDRELIREMYRKYWRCMIDKGRIAVFDMDGTLACETYYRAGRSAAVNGAFSASHRS